jgi:hypothetical protein
MTDWIGAAMIDSIRFLIPLWELKAEGGSLGAPLKTAEQEDLLLRLFLLTAAQDRSDLRVLLTCETTTIVGKLHYVGAWGLLAAVPALPPTSRILAGINDRSRAVEYVLPCVVASTYVPVRKGPGALALVVRGKPWRRHHARMMFRLASCANAALLGLTTNTNPLHRDT